MANKMNPQYKSTLFSTIFSDKVNALEMYNALNGTDYDNPDEITITTLKNVVFINRYNDVSYVIGGVFNLYEHQSTYNPNMPLRSFFYTAQSYEKMVDEKKLLSRSPVKIPTPKFVVFYNGSKEQPDVIVQKLSDSFTNKDVQGDLELVVTMLNVNYGHNAELMKKCKALNGYSLYISKFREYTEENGLVREEAARKAIEYCIDNGVMVDFFEERRKEVVGMMLEVTEEVIMEFIEELEFLTREQAETIEEKLIKIDAQAETIESKQKEIDAQAETIESKQKEIDAQAETIESKQKEIDAQAETIESKQKEIDAQAEIISAREKEIERLRNVLKEKQIEV